MAQWVKESGIGTPEAWLVAVARIQSLAWELLYGMSTDIKKKKEEEKKVAEVELSSRMQTYSLSYSFSRSP